MKLVANRVNGVHLRDLLPATDVAVDGVLAAVAYGNSASDITQDLVGHCVANKLRLDLWMRYDHTVPVSVELLQRLLKHQKDNVFTRFVPDRFHPKVIWWKGYGAYIGSANHTDNGWLTNIEAGVFLSDNELVANGMDGQLEDFFDYLRELAVTIPITADYITEMELLNSRNKSVYADAIKSRKHPIWEGPSFIQKKVAFDLRKDRFKREWLSTLGHLQSIQQQLGDYRPNWVSADVPAAWQVDQFLHAYYYNHVGDSLHKPYEDYHRRHQANPQAALEIELSGGSRYRRRPHGRTTPFMRVHLRCVPCWRKRRCGNCPAMSSPPCVATRTPPWITSSRCPRLILAALSSRHWIGSRGLSFSRR